MFIVFIRTIFLYFLVIFIMRLMGKRQIGELQPYEFVITIMISDLAALPMQDTRLPLILGVVPIVTLLFLKTVLTQLQLKSQFTRKILEGEPSILIYKGKINYESLKRQQINLDELFEELRLAGYFDLNEIQYAILENNGQLSFLTSQNDSNKSSSYDNYYNFNNQSSSSLRKDSSNAKNNSKDSNNSSNEESDSKPTLPIIYVLDGHINKNILTTSGKSRDWIENELRKYNINSINDVLIAMIDTHGEFVYQLYDKNKKVKGAKK